MSHWDAVGFCPCVAVFTANGQGQWRLFVPSGYSTQAPSAHTAGPMRTGQDHCERHAQSDEKPSEKPADIFKQLLTANHFSSFHGIMTKSIRKLAVTKQKAHRRKHEGNGTLLCFEIL